jgi:hypothetical protein
MNTSLYEQDYYLWLEKTAQLLKDRKLSELDIENLFEEITDIATEEKRNIEDNLILVFRYLLRYKYQPNKITSGDRLGLFQRRDDLIEDFSYSPSLKLFFIQIFEECYSEARELSAIETGLPLETFPVKCPFTVEQVLDVDYPPDENDRM